MGKPIKEQYHAVEKEIKLDHMIEFEIAQIESNVIVIKTIWNNIDFTISLWGINSSTRWIDLNFDMSKVECVEFDKTYKLSRLRIFKTQLFTVNTQFLPIIEPTQIGVKFWVSSSYCCTVIKNFQCISEKKCEGKGFIYRISLINVLP